MPDRYTEDGELLFQWCDEHPIVAQLDEINGPLVCQCRLDRAMGKPEPPTEAKIERSLRRMELLIGREWMEPRGAAEKGGEMKLMEAKSLSFTLARDYLTSREIAEFRELMASVGWPGSGSIHPRKHTSKMLSRPSSEVVAEVVEALSNA